MSPPFLLFIAGIVQGFIYSSLEAGMLSLTAGGQISLSAYAFCSWRRRIFLGLVISHIEQNYIGDPVEDFKRLDSDE